MPRRHMLLYFVLIALSSSVFGQNQADPLAATKKADLDFHEACDQWAAAYAKGEDTTSIEKRINDAYWRFMSSAHTYRDSLPKIDDNRDNYKPNEAFLDIGQFAMVGSYKTDDGHERSYMIGTGQSGIIVSVWERGASFKTKLPGHGINGILGIDPEEVREQFMIGVGKWEGDILKIPYKIKDITGTIDVRRNGAQWKFVPDRGAFHRGSWHPLER